MDALAVVTGHEKTTAPPDWRRAIAEPHRRAIRRWFLSIAALTWCVLIVGGATRLTHSGLSMVQWQPILGVVPPLSHADWQRRFEQYKQFPEYQKLRTNMTLQEFEFIYYWEYLHRLLARAIGIVFLLPFAFFLMRGWMNRDVAWRAAVLFGLGMMQGLMGWLMVASGLVDRPSVSHYRLAAHLSLAFMIFGYALWLARDLAVGENRPKVSIAAYGFVRRGLIITGVLLCTQIVWGAFVAGLKAGFFANTFPLMGGRWVPPEIASLDFVSNPVLVQWTHRVVGTVLTIAIIAFVTLCHRRKVDRRSLMFARLLMGVTLAQYALGVITLINAVPVLLGVAHQALAMLLFGVWIAWLHHARQLHAV